MSYDGPKAIEDKRSTFLGRALCAIGMHKVFFTRYWKGNFRPHFRCQRKGCDYFNG